MFYKIKLLGLYIEYLENFIIFNTNYSSRTQLSNNFVLDKYEDIVDIFKNSPISNKAN